MGKTKPHKAWLMLFGCCMLQGGSLGLIHNCRGIFYAPIIEDLGFGMGAFTFFLFFFGICSCAILPFISRFFKRIDSRLLLGGASAVFAGTVILMGFFNTLPAFYIAGAAQGVAGAFLLYYPVPLILGNWFKERLGFAVGASSSISGLVGAIANPLGSAIIERFGWRVGYWAMGGLSFVMLVPISVFLLRVRPEDCGLRPYGESEETKKETLSYGNGITAREVKRSPHFWLLIFCGLLFSMACAYYSHLSPFGTYVGYGASLASLLVSFSMVGNVVGKLALGHMHDRRGLDKTLLVGTLLGSLGIALLLINNYAVRAFGSLVSGAEMAMSTVMVAVAVKDIYGRECYGDLLPFTSIAATFGCTFMIMIIGYIVDALGSDVGYPVSFVVCLAMSLLSGLLLIVAVHGGRRLVKEHGTHPVS